MNCDQVQGLLSALIDHELPAEESEAVREHVECCEACAREMRAMLWVRGVAAQSPPVEVPDDLLPRLRSRVFGEPVAPWSWRYTAMLVATAAASGLLVALLISLARGPEGVSPIDGAGVMERGGGQDQLVDVYFGGADATGGFVPVMVSSQD